MFYNNIRMIKLIDESTNIEEANKIASHPLQSWEWGESRKQMGIRVVRWGKYDKGQLVATYQMTIHPLGIGGFSIGYLPRSLFPTEEILNHIKKYASENNIIFVKIEPNSKKTTEIKDKRLIVSPHPLFPVWTQTLDLTQSEENILKNMKQKTRYNIRLAKKKGVIVKEMSDKKGFEIFQKLYFDTCKRQKYYGHTKKYHEIIWNNLKNKIAHILIAFYNNKPLAAYELFYFNDVFYYPYGGTSNEDRNVMAANLLMWEAVLLGKKLGAKKFDMWGSLSPQYDLNDPWSGFTRFKEGYGTAFVEMTPSQDLVVSPLLYMVYNVVYSIRQKYLKLKKLG